MIFTLEPFSFIYKLKLANRNLQRKNSGMLISSQVLNDVIENVTENNRVLMLRLLWIFYQRIIQRELVNRCFHKFLMI